MDVQTSPKPLRTEYPGFLTHWVTQKHGKLKRRPNLTFPVKLQLPDQLRRHLGRQFAFMTADGTLTDEKGHAIIRP
jgi:hypothetical protein